jgi:hypothetical protein
VVSRECKLFSNITGFAQLLIFVRGAGDGGANGTERKLLPVRHYSTR